MNTKYLKFILLFSVGLFAPNRDTGDWAKICTVGLISGLVAGKIVCKFYAKPVRVIQLSEMCAQTPKNIERSSSDSGSARSSEVGKRRPPKMGIERKDRDRKSTRLNSSH